MYTLYYTSQFKKDLKKYKNEQSSIEKLKLVITQLEENGTIDKEYKPHKLTGNYKGFEECHIKPDLLLIWQKDESVKEISLARLGSHSQLF
ncbi:type II toxin-antitoxin system YafQ family toxin [Marivirga tractuosa]|jgi:mRNA interferase YafQ|uniref:type II toxin-antitoxin system YafQ family toxin n=1 Tax=Marivirga tractuosa TaxID=1006 RepID=UPI0035D0E2DB